MSLLIFSKYKNFLEIKIFPIQLDNPDEQAAAIRREVATREEALRDMSRISILIMHK